MVEEEERRKRTNGSVIFVQSIICKMLIQFNIDYRHWRRREVMMNYSQLTAFFSRPGFWVALWPSHVYTLLVSGWAGNNHFISEVMQSLYLICIRDIWVMLSQLYGTSDAQCFQACDTVPFVVFYKDLFYSSVVV